MDILKCIKDGLVGGVAGFFAGMLLFVPSCTVASFLSHNAREAEAIAQNIFVLSIFGGLLIGFVSSLVQEQWKLAARRQADNERRRREEEQHKAEQRSLGSSLEMMASVSLIALETMPQHLLTAEQLLDQAEREFKEEAFAPFWDCVEQATMQLGRFDEGVRTITSNATQYTQVARTYEGRPAHFPIALQSVRGMVAANTTSDRLKTIVRQGQRNFQFATIYEQRRTNQILIAGFSNLAQALDGVGRQIASSIDDLGERISDMSLAMEESLKSIDEQLQTGNRELVESVGALTKTTKQSAAEVQARHDRALEMLDNIQRRRIPHPTRSGDAAY